MSSHREMGERGKGPASALRSPGEPTIVTIKIPPGWSGSFTITQNLPDPEPEPLPPNQAEPQGEDQ